MSEYNTQTYEKRQSGIDAAREAFLAAGGTIQVLPSCNFIPVPVHREPEPLPVKASRARKEKASHPRSAEVMELGKSMTISEVSFSTGLSTSTLHRIAVDLRFFFKSGRRENGRLNDPEEDARKCERLIALRDAGLSRRQTALQMQIGVEQLERLIRQNGIDFPLKKSKKCAD